MDVSISIVNYFSSDLIAKAIESIIKFTKNLNYEIIVTNNSPSDTDFYSLSKKFSEVSIKLIDLKDNVGFSKANNTAFNNSLGKYFLVYNPDLFLVEDSITFCYNFLEKNQKYVCCVPKFNYPNGEFQASGFYKQKGGRLFYNSIPNASFFLNTHIEQSEITPISNENVVDIDVACGAFLFVKHAVYEKINGFDEDFFLYGEDWEISNRIGKMGKIALLNCTSVIHMHGGSSEREFNDESQDLNLFSRKGTQMFVSILLWQKKEFGRLVLLKLFFIITFSLILNFTILLKKMFRKDYLSNFKLFFNNFKVISKEVFHMVINRHKVYRVM